MPIKTDIDARGLSRAEMIAMMAIDVAAMSKEEGCKNFKKAFWKLVHEKWMISCDPADKSVTWKNEKNPKIYMNVKEDIFSSGAVLVTYANNNFVIFRHWTVEEIKDLMM